MAVNSVAISGNLTRDPELRATASGTGVLNFSVAVNERQKSREAGEWEDYPNYVDCVVFGRRAESLARIISKGTKVAVQGHLHQSRWQDRNTGSNRSKIEVFANEVDIMSRVTSSQQPEYETPAPCTQQAAQAQDVYDEDIPF